MTDTGLSQDAVSSDILSRLEEYGNSWLDDDGYKNFLKKSCSKSQRRKIDSFNKKRNIIESSSSINGSLSRRQRKKLKHKNKIGDAGDEQKGDNCSEIQIKNSNHVEAVPMVGPAQKKLKLRQKMKLKNKKLEKLKTELGLYMSDGNDSNITVNDASGDKDKSNKVEGLKIQSGIQGNLCAKENSKGAEVVVFTDPAKRKKKKQLSSSPMIQSVSTDVTPKKLGESQPEMNLRDARFDVLKFGIKGFTGDKKETAVQDMLIQLGAKPAKKKFYNYKEYMNTRKQEIVAEKERREMDRKLGFSVSNRDKKRRRKDGVGYLDGQIGSYRSGIQMLNRKDIQRVKKMKVKK